jgi:hypothetical protein
MFFDQIKDIDGSIKALREQLVGIGGAVDQQLDQLDDIAAHIIALEAVLIQVLKQTNVDVDAAKEWVRANTESSVGKPGGSTKARTIVEQLTAR